MKLVIAEKPSVAMNIAKVIGAKTRKQGYVEGNGYIVSWCVGHLIQMSSPDKYNPRYRKWNLEDLPIIPVEYKYEVSSYTKKQYTVLKKLMNDRNVTEVINACDAGREGELIFRLVYEQARCKKPIKRLWISSMEDSAIKEGFENLKDGKMYENLYQSALARGKADWLIGMNLSRYYSCKTGKNYSVGRVQTPTLAMIEKRDREIEDFQKEKYFTVELELEDMTLSSGRIDSEEEAQALRENIPEIVIILKAEKKRKEVKPDKLYDLTTLQRECNKYFGYSAKQTLDYAQSLYERKLITYPRTDSRYLTDDMVDTAESYVDTFGPDRDEKNFKSLFDSQKVTDHHAIIPTQGSIRISTRDMTPSEEKVFELIKAKFLAARAGNQIMENTKITVQVNGQEFTVTGNRIIDPGFTRYLEAFTKQRESKYLPEVHEGDEISVTSTEIKEKYTKPPKHYTEDTLLKSMEQAGNEELEKGIKVEKKGLGTPATRAGILENLIKKKLIKRDGKKLVVTRKGQDLSNIVANFLKDPKTTAEWEMKLYDVAEGKEEAAEFTREIENRICQVLT